MHRAVPVAAFLAGFLLALISKAALGSPTQESTPTLNLSTSTPTLAPTLTPAPTPTLNLTSPAATQTPNPRADVETFGWTGEVQCFNCTPFSARVRLSSYNPQAFDPAFPRLNCWAYSEDQKYCVSPTWIGVPWEALWGFGAACPEEWPIGTWVDIDQVGYFICFDHGDAVKCVDGVCRVDLLGPGGEPWDGKSFDATLWVPPSYLIRLSEKGKGK